MDDRLRKSIRALQDTIDVIRLKLSDINGIIADIADAWEAEEKEARIEYKPPRIIEPPHHYDFTPSCVADDTGIGVYA